MKSLDLISAELVDSSTLLCDQGNVLLNHKLKDSTKPVVAAWGLMNAGKSYLLNMLTQHIENEYFKTNDFRETAEIKKFETEDFIFLDTPGLDACAKDDLTAIDGVGKADVVLFVHQLQGELEAIEIEFLQGLVDSFGEHASDNIIIVLSKVDKESNDKIEAIKQKVLNQCEIYVGFEPQCIAVSNTVYKKGAEKNIQGLMKNSNIEILHNTLESLLESANDVRIERHIQEKQQLIKKLRIEQKNIEDALEQYNVKTSKFNEDVKSFNTDITKLKTFMTKLSKEYYDLELQRD